MAVEVAKITTVVLTYWTISITMVFANKYLVGEKSTVDISLFVAWIQCIVTVLLVSAFNALHAVRTGNWELTKVPRSALVSKPVLQMAFCFVLMLSFNNLCLKLVGVSFYQVARSTTIIFVVVFSVTILKKSLSPWIAGCCVLVATGFFLGVDQEKVMGSLSVRGVAFGVASSVFIALTGIFTKTALDVVDRDELRLTLCTNVVAVVFFVPVVLLTGQLSDAIASGQLVDVFFWTCLFLSGILGTLMAWISAVQINVTSPVTHHISSNTKAILQTIIAVVYYGETKSGLWWLSVLLVVTGACSYAIRRYHEEKASTKSFPPPIAVTVVDDVAVDAEPQKSPVSCDTDMK